MINYESTRGEAPELSFADALITGLATDGGLYCPSVIPELPPTGLVPGKAGSGQSYAEVAQAVMWPFVEGSISQVDFEAIVADSYSVFRSPEVAPLLQIAPNHYLLDLAKGPTLAFKDIALQLVGRLMDHELERRNQQVTVLGATSGDTGSAAIEALAGRNNIRVVILHPEGRVSDVQRRQMTTVDAGNVRNVAIDGTFDDCQDLVKAAFNDPALRSEFRLAAVNSINWARVMAQIVYYVTSSLRLTAASDSDSATGTSSAGSPVSFSVPTGNFGNVLAGWYAKQMGLPIEQLIVASNANDVLPRFFETGELVAKPVAPSLSPSMDIQVSSNFERLLWEASGRQGEAVGELLAEFRAEGSAAVDGAWCRFMASDFDAGRIDDEETLAEIKRVWETAGVLIDPHTAVGTAVGRRLRRDSAVPLVTLATADPAKFPDAVEKATGERPQLPDFLSELLDRPEFYERAPNSLQAVTQALKF